VFYLHRSQHPNPSPPLENSCSLDLGAPPSLRQALLPAGSELRGQRKSFWEAKADSSPLRQRPGKLWAIQVCLTVTFYTLRKQKAQFYITVWEAKPDSQLRVLSPEESLGLLHAGVFV
jgi:hypothetical protein